VTKLKPRQQGDIGELSAMEWLAGKGANIYVPVGHSPDVDLIATIDGQVLRVEVKTSAYMSQADRWQVTISTSGGNQSWNGLVKHFERDRCEYLFVLVGDGRRWFIPTGAVDSGSSLLLGGPKYKEFEIDRGRPLEAAMSEPRLQSGRSPGGVPKRSNGLRCKRSGLRPSEVRILPPPLSASQPVKPTNYERKPGQNGEALINQKRRLTIPQRPFFQAGFANGGRVRVRADGPGRIVVEQFELPGWAQAKADE
jgi:hypothetical protein